MILLVNMEIDRAKYCSVFQINDECRTPEMREFCWPLETI
jgi:hypothetical protein